jgi:predicted ribosome quality control (RQC) complex YloA/Tae2 family protein
VHNNYYFFKHLIPELEETLIGMSLIETFSQNKNELVLGFSRGPKTQYVVAHLTGQFTCLAFPHEFSKAKKNIANLFVEVNNSVVESILLYENERAFTINFEGSYQLLFKLFGRQANVLLVKDNKVHSLFRKGFSNDLNLNPADLGKPIDQSEKSIQNALPNYQSLFPTLGKELVGEINNKIKGKSEVDTAKLITYSIGELLNAQEYSVIENNNKIKLTIGTKEATIKDFSSPMEAITFFFYLNLQNNNFLETKKRLLAETNKQLGKTEVYLTKIKRKKDNIATNLNYSQTADLLMANLHRIDTNAKSIEVENFYANNELITIKLNPRLSAQANAERLYQKSKNLSVEINNLEQAILDKTRLLQELTTRKSDIELAESYKELKKYLKEPIRSSSEKKTPFKEFLVEGFTVYVGNNAKQNDLLTLKYARKDDLFFHAKDVAGSHVILKYNSAQNFPKSVLEKVAAIAAYYSKRKNDSLCPVGYTPKKYVRKSKGSVAGSVLVDREKVLLVKPELPS